MTNLTAKGYTKFTTNFPQNTTECWQKKMLNPDGICFYLQLYKYDYTNVPNLPNKVYWTANVQFSRGDETWDIDFQVPNDYTIEQVENRMTEMWVSGNFETYERNS